MGSNSAEDAEFWREWIDGVRKRSGLKYGRTVEVVDDDDFGTVQCRRFYTGALRPRVSWALQIAEHLDVTAVELLARWMATDRGRPAAWESFLEAADTVVEGAQWGDR